MSTPESSDSIVNEDDLRKELREMLQQVTRREPLETTYKYLLLNGDVTPRKPILPKDKLYFKPVTADLREHVETFPGNEWDRIAQRSQQGDEEQWEESKMRAALTLREPKKHEQEALLKQTTKAKNTPQVLARKAYLEGIALGLQSKELKVLKKKEESRQEAAQVQRKLAKRKEEDRQMEVERKKEERAENRKRKRREEMEEEDYEEELREKEEHRRQQEDAPKHNIANFLMPKFDHLWKMEFAHLGNTNPFRTVIDRSNCIAMGVPDYSDIVKQPMNLTWIQKKLQKAEYQSVAAFFNDVELMIKNALLYNSDPTNDYHLAAKEMAEHYKKFVKRPIVEYVKKRRDGQTK
mmetsp:Transcript_27218/g.45387  ORF Transcript_27218/g.45387 Transcript_27218/m.45387 type:complete len:351 (+) Transcript_27218:77-1129(+)